MAENKKVILYGRVFLTGSIKAETGLHIGKGNVAVAIGDMDNPVVRDPLTDRPYIPGSSLKGKMRSLVEKKEGKEQNESIGKGVKIHVCGEEEYRDCVIGHIFGVPGKLEFAQPTRLIVRDIFLADTSAAELKGKTDLPYTEVKWEVAIDRVTSAATPRQMERVPAGAVFHPLELVYNIYDADDITRFEKLLEAMELVEDDYLGGLGSRGSGKVSFRSLKLAGKAKDSYSAKVTYNNKEWKTLKELVQEKEQIQEWLKKIIPTQGV